MPSPHPLASFVIDSGQVGKEAVSASYSTLAVDAPRITLAPSRPLIYYFKPNTFSKKKKKTVHLDQSFYSRDRGCYTQQRSAVWKSWASSEELGMKKKK